MAASPSQRASIVAGAAGSGLTRQLRDEEESFSLQDVIAGLFEQDEEVRIVALGRLAQMVDVAEGVHAMTIGECIRNFGALQPLLTMVQHSCTCARALRVIGNLASDVVDQRSGYAQVCYRIPFYPRPHNSHLTILHPHARHPS